MIDKFRVQSICLYSDDEPSTSDQSGLSGECFSGNSGNDMVMFEFNPHITLVYTRRVLTAPIGDGQYVVLAQEPWQLEEPDNQQGRNND
jgi:hypothetical protein